MLLRIKNKLLISFILLNLMCTGIAMFAIYSETRPHFLEAVEYTLIDMSRFLASGLGAQASHDPNGQLHVEDIRRAAGYFSETSFPGKRNAYDQANRSALQIYVTDANGKVLFDSNQGKAEGSDFSQWRDVMLTLQGKYGARATRVDPNNPETSTHFVAAPIMVKGKIAGVVSVGKTVQSVSGFLSSSRMKMLLIFAGSLLAALVVSLAASYWIARPVLRLENYVKSLNTPDPRAYPHLPEDEIGALGKAFETLRKELEGKTYVEKYVHNLTHEIKAPLTAIIGAAELVNGGAVSPEDRQHLLGNIRSEALRLQDIAEKLLELASLEARDQRGKFESFDLRLTLEEVVESLEVAARKNSVTVKIEMNQEISAHGERFLIWRAIANLLQNAIDFAPENSVVIVKAEQADGETKVCVIDSGPGIPDYAKARITEKFFSLERPRTGKKSSGLGLSFVNEVMNVHGGKFSLESTNGTEAHLAWRS